MKSLNGSIYPAIFKRQSTRRYSDSLISTDKLYGLRVFMQEVVPLLSLEQSVFEIQRHKGNTMKIAAYAKNQATSFINLAFMLQQMDLFIQTNGMGAQWSSTVRATEKQNKGFHIELALYLGWLRRVPFA